MSQTVKLNCPVCQHEYQREFVTLLDTRQNPQLKSALLNGQYFSFECDHCGAKRQMNCEFIYLDPEQQLLLVQLPDFKQNPDRLAQLIADEFPHQTYNLNEFTIRLVLSSAELIEKIQIFDSGENDGRVEMVKALTDGLFAQEHPEAIVKARYFYPQQSHLKLLYITDNTPILADYHQKLVDFINEKYAKVINHLPKGECLVINHNWAFEHLEKKTNKDSTPDNQ